MGRVAELSHDNKKLYELMAALQEAIDFIDQYSDTVDGPAGPEANSALTLVTHLTNVLEGGY
jgi:hypothetical protein